MASVTRNKSNNFSWLSILGVLVVTGCGGQPEANAVDQSDMGATDHNSPLSALPPTPEGFYAAGVPSSDWLACGTHEFPIPGTSVRLQTEAEEYNLRSINATLMANAAYQTASGLSSVANCDDARLYMTSVADYLKANPDYQELDSEVDRESAQWASQGAVDESSLTVDLGPSSGDGEVPKIFNAQKDGSGNIVWRKDATGNTVFANYVNPPTSSRESVVQIWIAKSPPIYDTVVMCSAVRISDTMFLTSAHCVEPNPTPGANGKTSYVISPIAFRNTSGGVTAWGPTRYAPAARYLAAATMQHPKYKGGAESVGTLMSDYDVAIINIFDPTVEQQLRGMGDYMQIASRPPKYKEIVQAVGWGFERNGDTIESLTLQTQHETALLVRKLSTEAPEGKDGMTVSYTYVKGDGTCNGDSGGAELKDASDKELLKGIFSKHGVTAVDMYAACPLQSTTSTATTVFNKFNAFIRPAMNTLRSVNSQTLRRKACYLYTFNGSTDDPESYFDCNIDYVAP